MTQLLQFISEYGLIFVFACVLLEQAGAPVLAYPVLMLTGALATRGEFHVLGLLGTAVAACLIADAAWYFAGYRFGRGVLRLLCRISLSPDGCVRQTESIFSRWGAPSLMVAKFIPGFASVATALAGSIGIRRAPFLFFDAIGASLWAGSALMLGWLFASAVDEAIANLGRYGRWGLALFALVLAAYLLYKWRQRHQFNAKLRMERISPASLAELIDNGRTPVIVDVRLEDAAREGRIPGSITLSDGDWPEQPPPPPLDAAIVVYCACPNDASAALFARKLLQRGFTNVRPLQGGIDAWRAAGRPLQS